MHGPLYTRLQHRENPYVFLHFTHAQVLTCTPKYHRLNALPPSYPQKGEFTLNDIASKTMADSKRLLRLLEAEFADPSDAFFACVLAVAVIGKGADMPLDTIVEGISAAYSDLKSPSQGGHDVH